MKKKLGFLLSIMLVLSLVGYGIVKSVGKSHVIKQNEDELVIATSFYPVYIMALNLTDQVEGVRVVNLTENQIGCVHDYQLTTQDMREIAGADIVILNGGEMEVFMVGVLDGYPDLKVIDASEGLSFLEGSSHNHDHSHEAAAEDEEANFHADEETHTHEDEEAHTHEDEETHSHNEDEEHADESTNNLVEASDKDVHNHSAINGHVWMDMDRYQQQIATVAKYLCEYDSERAVYYENNAKIYMDKVSALQSEYSDLKELTNGKEVIIFHDAFAYLADALGMEVVFSVEVDSESALSAGEIAEVIEEINLHSIQYLFTEEQYSTKIADQVSSETGAKVYVMDSLVTGRADKDTYLNGMKQNLDYLTQIYSK